MRHKLCTCNAGQKSQPAGYSFRSEDYDHFQVIFILTGILYLTTNKQEYRLTSGGCVMLPRRSRFTLFCRTRSYAGVYFSAFDGELTNLRGSALSLSATPEMITFTEMMHEESSRTGSGADQVLRGLGLALAWKVVRLSQEEGGRKDPQAYAHYWAECARHALEATLYTGKGAREALTRLPLSYRQLARYFVQVYGMSPKVFQMHSRLQEARRLLTTTAMPITAIAYELHFSSSQHFATQFFQRTGMSPSTCRARR